MGVALQTLDTPVIKGTNTHHRPPRQITVGVRSRFGKWQQLPDRCPDQHVEVTRLGHVSAQGHHSRYQRFAMLDGTEYGVCGADIETLDPEMCTEFAVRDLDARKHADELLFAAGRIARGNSYHRHRRIAEPFDGSPHGCDGFRLVVFDADQDALGASDVAHDVCAGEHAIGPFAHQPVIASDPWLALGAIGDHHIGAGRQLDVGGEAGAAGASHTRYPGQILDAGRRRIHALPPRPARRRPRGCSAAGARRCGRWSCPRRCALRW